MAAGKSSTDKELFGLCWSVDELGRLNETGRHLYVEIDDVLALLDDPSTDTVHLNVARRLTKIQDAALPFIRGVTRYQRNVSTHVLVTMIRETRSHMPFLSAVSLTVASKNVKLEHTSRVS